MRFNLTFSNFEYLTFCFSFKMDVEKLVSTTNLLLVSILLLNRKKRKRNSPRFWVRDIFKRRKTQGMFNNLVQEMRLSDSERYFNYLRMSNHTFNKLLSIIGPSLTKMYHIREPISPAERLALTLRYLASGDSQISMSYAFRIGASTVSRIIRETCDVLWDCLNEIVLLTPSEPSWLEIAHDFLELWHLPNCVGAIDGKHVIIEAPPNSGSTYFNYKGQHSIVLLAVCDARYRFTLVDIGAEGRHSDGGIFRNSAMGQLILNGNICFPASSPIEYGGDPFNYYIVADEAFPLTSHIMRPYPGRFLPQSKRIFNYRLSRGRRIIENVFGIMTAKWRIYRKPIIASIETVQSIVKATVCLHNFIMNQELEVTAGNKNYCSNSLIDKEDRDGNIIIGEWRKNTVQSLSQISRVGSNMYGKNSESMRNQLTSHLLFDGAVPFQWDK